MSAQELDHAAEGAAVDQAQEGRRWSFQGVVTGIGVGVGVALVFVFLLAVVVELGWFIGWAGGEIARAIILGSFNPGAIAADLRNGIGNEVESVRGFLSLAASYVRRL
ncbi:MAG: hypothetical protein JOZ39_03305 [Chloroflexi bacterium]|nr:hypothetical protein [Chloroflexota bacterium]